MATRIPAERAEERRRIREALADEAGIQENLLKTIQKQTKEYEREVTMLKDINLQKQIINATQKEINERTRNLDYLENNILKRNNEIIKTEEKISEIRSGISGRVQRRTYSGIEQENLIKLKNMWSSFRKWQEGKSPITLSELNIVRNIAAMQGVTITQIRTQNSLSREKLKQTIRYIDTLRMERDIQSNQLKMESELVKLKQEQSNLSKALVKDWFQGLPIISKTMNYLDFGANMLRAMGKDADFLVRAMKGPLLIVTASFLYLLTKSFEIFQELDKAAFAARKEMGMMRKEHQILRTQAESLYIQYANLGVTAEQVYKTQKAISMELGSALSSTKNIVTQTALMAAQFGISEDTTVRMLKTLGQLGNTTAESQIKMMGFAGALANSAKVPLPQVMEDIAKASETTRTMMSKLPLDMVKTAVEARRLGTTLDKMTSSSSKLLNFTESIEAEMETSVLLGRPINLQLARQLSYNGKILEANKEILRISKQIGFEQLDRFQMEAFARATGKSVDELRSMIQASREQEEIAKRALTDKGLAKQLVELNALKAANKAVADARGKDFNLMIKQQENQEKLTALSNTWKKVVIDLSYQFLPIIGGLLEITKLLVPIIGFSIRMVVPLGIVASIIGKVTMGLKSVFSMIVSISRFAGFAGPFLRAIPIIGWVITGLQFVYSLFKRFATIDWKNLSIGEAILEGIKAVGDALYDALIKPFADALNWIKSVLGFGGESPSKLGLSILNGILSIGSSLFNAITSPFKSAWSYISNLFSSNKIQPSIEKPIVSDKLSSISIPVDRPATTNEIQSYRELGGSNVETNKQEFKAITAPTAVNNDPSIILQALLAEIKGLRNDLTAGKVAVNMDGQLVSTNMVRGNKFRGAYGALSG